MGSMVDTDSGAHLWVLVHDRQLGLPQEGEAEQRLARRQRGLAAASCIALAETAADVLVRGGINLMPKLVTNVSSMLRWIFWVRNNT